MGRRFSKGYLFLIILLVIAAYQSGVPKDREPGAKRTPNVILGSVAKLEESWRRQAVPYTGGLPWQEDPRTKAVLKRYGATVIMAAFRATLQEPIEGEAHNIALAAERLSGTVLQPGQVFSQNGSLGPYTENRGYRAGPTYMGNRYVTTIGGGVCKISSLLYNVVIFSDLRVIERHPHSMTVPYVPPGQDATVYYGFRDFKFQNTTDGPVVIAARFVDKTLYMALYGRRKPPEIRWHHRVLKRVPAWTEQHLNPELPPGKTRVVMEGQEGIVVRSWITIKTPAGKTTVKKLGTDWYDPSPRIVEYGPARRG